MTPRRDDGQASAAELSPERPAATALSRFDGAPDRPVFVGGCPRSGTTLLRTMLNNHPDLAIPHETRIIVDTWQRRAEFGELTDPRRRREIAEWLLSRKVTRAKRLEVAPETILSRMADAPPTLGSVLGTPYLLYAEQQGKSRWGDKRPMYARYLDVVFAMFPDAQFVNVVRDPRDAVASMRKVGWYKGDVAPATELWQRSLRAADAGRKRLAPDQFLEVRYEDLVVDPESELRRVNAFLGLDLGGLDAMLTFHERADTAKSKMFWRVSRPVTTGANRRWEQSLSAPELALVEHVTRDRMRRYAYEPAAGGMRPPAQLRRRYARRRREKLRQALDWNVNEAKLRFTYRQPVAARLTSSQRGE